MKGLNFGGGGAATHYIGIMENKMETTIVHWGNIGIMENKMETTIVHWGNIGIMENKMETTIMENQMEKQNEMETRMNS